MRLLHVVHSCNPLAGGVAEAVNRLAEASTEVGHKAEIATCDQPSSSFLEELDVAARGLDIPHVSHIYNYDIPAESKEYIIKRCIKAYL